MNPFSARLLKFFLPSLVALLASPLVFTTASQAASDENQVQLMDLVIAMSGVPSASVPLSAVINTRNRNTIDEFLIDMPWWAEKLGAVDRHITRSQLQSSELNTPGITDFSGHRLSIMAFKTQSGFSLTQGGKVAFHFRVAPSVGGGCRVLTLEVQKQADWDRNSYANFGVTLPGAGKWISGLTVRIRDEGKEKYVSGLQVTEQLGGSEQTRSVTLSRLPTGACPE